MAEVHKGYKERIEKLAGYKCSDNECIEKLAGYKCSDNECIRNWDRYRASKQAICSSG